MTNSVILDAKNFTEHTGQGLWLIKHYSPKCPHCRRMAPAWVKLTDELAAQFAEDQVFFGEVNCLDNRKLCEDNKVDGYPTISLFSDGKYVEEMTLTPTYEEMKPYAVKLSKRRASGEFEKPPEAVVANDNRDWDDGDGAPAAPAPAPAVKTTENKREEVYNEDGEVVILTKENFAEKTSTGPWFVKFYAPWCPHCQTLAPVWDKLAAETRSKINVGKVNCDEASVLCSKYNVQGYPTLKLLWDAETVDYKGERKLESFKTFVDGVLAQPHNVVAADDLRRARAEKDVLFVFAYDKSDTSAKTKMALTRVKSNAQKMFLSKSLNIVSDLHVARTIIPGEDPELPMLVALKDNQVVKFEGTLTNDDQLHEWYYAERFPLLPQLDRENSDDLFYDTDYLVLAVLDTDQGKEYMAHYRDAVRSAAIEYQKVYESAGKKPKGTVRFAWVDGNKWSSYVDRVFHIRRTDWPAIVIAQPSEDQYFRNDIKGGVIEPTKMGIFMAVRAALDGKLKPQSTSSIIIRGARGAVAAIKSVMGFFFGSLLRAILSLAATCALGYYLFKRSGGARSGSYGVVKSD
ncbi:thioredoxin-domain-containing protein [Martensiomyces pterosporus]|nr:thioredoxin-domain-containing protein [Martensiomyces pterosporus]